MQVIGESDNPDCVGVSWRDSRDWPTFAVINQPRQTREEQADQECGKGNTHMSQVDPNSARAGVRLAAVVRSLPARLQNGRLDAFIVDLNGTVIDSTTPATVALNTYRQLFKLLPLSKDGLRRAMGDGVEALIQRTFPRSVLQSVDPNYLRKLLQDQFLAQLSQNPTLLPGAREFLDETRAVLVLLTQTPMLLTRGILEAASLNGVFDRVYCPDNLPATKPNPAAVTHILDDLGVLPENAVLIADGHQDFEAAMGAGVMSIGLRGGSYAAGRMEPSVWVNDWWELDALLRGSARNTHAPQTTPVKGLRL